MATTTTETSVVTPVKGMVWKHAKRTDWRGEPKVLTVTSLQKSAKGTLVYSKDDLGQRVKTPLETFEKWVLEVVSVPAPVTTTAVKMTEVECMRLHQAAHAAGMAAGEAAVPAPMVVERHENPLDDESPVEQSWFVPEGLCGFAWVVTPGNTSFGRWGKKRGLLSKHYEGGMHLWVRAFGQSVTRKEAYAAAYAAVLREAGLKAYSGSRLD